jgi:(methylthio)acryloyl-CoA hydratase
MATIASLPDLPPSLNVEIRGNIALLGLSRPEKRNALDDETVLGLEAFFHAVGDQLRVAVLYGEGEHFSSGLDLNSLTARTAEEGLMHSRMWHRAWSAIEFGPVPVISALHGAVIGGGLELAAATHLRVADRTAYYALPEGQRGIFLGGGGSVRLPRLIGTARIVDMMLTGRVLSAEEGHAAGLTQYLVDPGESLEFALQLAEKVAATAPLTAYGAIQALPRISNAAGTDGYLMESLMAAVASSSDEAQIRMREYLEGRASRVTREGAS